MTLPEAINSTRAALLLKYSSYWDLAPSERRLLAMAYLCDQLKVRESGGNNRGEWVGVFQSAAGIGPGDPWCAAALTFASIVANAERPERPEDNPAAVLGWRKWAIRLEKMVSTPARGSIAMHQTTASTGHIGVVVRVVGPMVYSIEGNTGSGEGGSQRDGDGMYRRVRTKAFWSWGFADI
jgi:hypothetical protein